MDMMHRKKQRMLKLLKNPVKLARQGNPASHQTPIHLLRYVAYVETYPPLRGGGGCTATHRLESGSHGLKKAKRIRAFQQTFECLDIG